MSTIYNCDSGILIDKASEELKKVDKIKAPEWAVFAKTGMHKERPPLRADWWHVRTASVLRQIYRYGPIGVSKLRTKYGGKKNRGYKKSHFFKGSGNILRKILQQLEAAGLVKKGEAGVHKGRVVTAEGKKFLDSIASTLVVAPVPKVVVKVKTEKKEVKKPEAKKEEKPTENKETKKPEVKKEIENKKEEQKKETKEEKVSDKKETKEQPKQKTQ